MNLGRLRDGLRDEVAAEHQHDAMSDDDFAVELELAALAYSIGHELRHEADIIERA